MAIIPSGYILLARTTQESEIWTRKPDKWFKIWIHILFNVSYFNKKYRRGTDYFRYHWIAKETRATENQVEHCVRWLRKVGQIATQKATHGIIITVLNYDKYQDLKNYKSDTKSDTKSGTEAEQKRNRSDNTYKEGKEYKEGNTVPNGTSSISLKNKTYSLTEITMNNKPQGVMMRLAYHYLQIAGIELEAGQVYDANKIAKGLSAIYRECGKDEDKAKERITIAGGYFNSKGLSWTPQAVWRDWELIQKWIKQDKPKLNPDLYE